MALKPLVSVIIPVYNVEKYLRDCMDSILYQTYEKLDIVLVDDGSKDGSGRLCDKYAGLDSRVQVIHKENGGLMSAWMAGVEKSRGEYLTFVDSDDWIELTMVEELVEKLSGKEKEIICANYLIEKENRAVPMIQAMKPGIYDRRAIEEHLFPFLLGKEKRMLHFSRCMKLISKVLIIDNMNYCTRQVTMGEDMNIILPAILDAQRIVVVEKGLYYHYRFVDTSIVHEYNPRLYEKVCLLYTVLQNILRQKELALLIGKRAEVRELLLQGLKKEYVFLMFYVLKNELRGPARGCCSRIKRMISEAKQRGQKEYPKKAEWLEEEDMEVSGRANRLLYFIWKKPTMLRILFGCAAMRIFDRIS